MHVSYEVASFSVTNDELERLLEMASFYVHKMIRSDVFENNRFVLEDSVYSDHLAIYRFLCGVTGKSELYDSFLKEVEGWVQTRKEQLAVGKGGRKGE